VADATTRERNNQKIRPLSDRGELSRAQRKAMVIFARRLTPAGLQPVEVGQATITLFLVMIGQHPVALSVIGAFAQDL
jgi:hypothetical protein